MAVLVTITLKSDTEKLTFSKTFINKSKQTADRQAEIFSKKLLEIFSQTNTNISATFKKL